MKNTLPPIKIFADGADAEAMVEAYREGIVKGFTTNPTLMKKEGVKDYKAFGKKVLAAITDLPISFEVVSDDFKNMEKEARILHSWGKNVFVKIPITNTKGESSAPLIKILARDGVKINVTAILSLDQVEIAYQALSKKTPGVISVFAGRIADTGRDPIKIMKKAVRLLKGKPLLELLWASPRELLNIFQAAEVGCHIITCTNDILKKIPTIGKNLEEFSLDTVKMFVRDVQDAGLTL